MSHAAARMSAARPTHVAGFMEGGKADSTASRAASRAASSPVFGAGASMGGWMMMRTPRGMAIGRAPVPKT
eukprot:scaffold31709_cov118-Isochrysis_galbana.AAC.13